jgi:hypothetical protein
MSNETKSDLIKCELRQSAVEPSLFHLVELRTGKEKLVAYGGVFPLKKTKKWVRDMEKDYGITVTNLHEFFRSIREQVKEKGRL